MKYRAYIYTLALLGALALAAVSGGLLTTSDNVVYAADPDFDDQYRQFEMCLKTRRRASTSATPSRPPTPTR